MRAPNMFQLFACPSGGHGDRALIVLQDNEGSKFGSGRFATVGGRPFRAALGAGIPRGADRHDGFPKIERWEPFRFQSETH